jgi:antitoxin VapB
MQALSAAFDKNVFNDYNKPDVEFTLHINSVDIATITQQGSFQSVQLPTGFQFSAEEVCVSRFGDAVVLYPKEAARTVMLQSLSEFTSDFMEMRDQPNDVEERNWL